MNAKSETPQYHSPESIGKAVFACSASNDSEGLLHLYRVALRSREMLKAFYLAFDEAAWFLTDLPDCRISRMAKVRVRLQSGGKLRRKLLEETGGDLNGVILKNPSFDVYAMLSSDASEPGRFRASLFDSRGFMSHICRDSYEAVLDEVLQDGFVDEAPGALERFFCKDEWLNWYQGRGEKV